MSPARKLTYHFLQIPHDTRVQIALDLNLMGLEEVQGFANKPTYEQRQELYVLILKRASEKGKLAEIWDATEKAFSELFGREPLSNPYRC